MADFDDELRRILADNKCTRVRAGKGSHEIWWSPITQRHFTVSTKIKSRHTANGVLKQAGIPKSFH
jgi:hypothetical protein